MLSNPFLPQKDAKKPTYQELGILILIAYTFSILIRMIWVYQFSGNPQFTWNDQLMINTNDGYYFASAAQKWLEGTLQYNHQVKDLFYTAAITFSAFSAKFLPISLDTAILYMPAVVSSMVVIPIILIGRLFNITAVGFFAALLGSIAWSYYNRTMVGYYDTDMFSVLFQFSIFYGFLSIVYKKNISSIIYTALMITLYPYFYFQGVSIVYAIFMMMIAYLGLEYFKIVKSNETKSFENNENLFFESIILLSIILMTTVPIEIRLMLFTLACFVLYRFRIDRKTLFYSALVIFLAFLVYGNIIQLIMGKVFSYLDRGVESEGLHFYQVIQTVREAGSIPMITVANRISGSGIGLALSAIGYLVLIYRHKPFIIALPLIGVGLFSYVGGLRFTVYSVPIAALSAVYLFYVISTFFKDKKAQYLFMGLATLAMLYPNIKHIEGYKVPTVLNNMEVQDLEKLNNISKVGDYTLSWWDYGYPIWFYSNTDTLTDGGKHGKDNFIISKILQTTSPVLAANLSRVAIESYVSTHDVTGTLFKNGEEGQIDPFSVLSEMDDSNYVLPKKTRDIYLYLPYRMLNIFPTVAIFGNLDLTTGKAERKISFYPTSVVQKSKGILKFRNGIVFDATKGIVTLGKQKVDVKYFIVTQNTQKGTINLQSQLYHADGKFVVVYLKSYNRFIVMDTETFKSTYVQMFMLGKYDKNLFELVVSSAYSRIYKLKI